MTHGRLAGRLQAARHRAFVGRKEELAAFDEALRGGGVLFVHGPGGIGKSALLGRFSQLAEEAGRTVLLLDGHLLDPSPSAFLTATRSLLADEHPVLLVDAFEHLHGLESWLRESFLPTLPAGALVVVAGRTPPDLTWQADPGWADLVRVIGLGDLDPMDAAALLDSRGVPGERHGPLLAFAGGHPLALTLGAAANPTQDVVATLLDRLVGDVPGPAHRRALEVCAYTYLSTQDTLRAVLPDEDTAALFSWLRRQPFVESSPFGLAPHEVVRRIVEADLRWRDPRGHADLHRRLEDHLIREIREGEDVLRAVASLFHLHRDESRTSVWRAAAEIHEDAFRPEDAEDLLRLTTEPDVVSHWTAKQPQAFRLYRRTANGELVGASAFLRLDSAADAQPDPVTATAWAAHTHTPLRPGEHVAVYRTWMRDWDTSPVRNLVQWRAMGWFLRSPGMAWSFMPVRDDDHYGMHDLGERAREGNVEYRLLAHDWRAVPAQTWLDRLLRPTGEPPVRHELAVLSQEEFTDAVRKALRHLSKPGELATNPLTRSRLLAGRPDPAHALRELLEASIRDLDRDPRAGKPHRALDVTYLRGAPTQEAAAERLGLSFTTYRRHLASGIDRLADDLWRRELAGPNQRWHKAVPNGPAPRYDHH